MVFAPEGPSAAPDRLEIEELSLVVANLEVGNGGLVASLDTLFARFLPPGEALDRVVVVLGAAADDLYDMKDLDQAMAAGQRLLDEYPNSDLPIRRSALAVVGRTERRIRLRSGPREGSLFR